MFHFRERSCYFAYLNMIDFYMDTVATFRLIKKS